MQPTVCGSASALSSPYKYIPVRLINNLNLTLTSSPVKPKNAAQRLDRTALVVIVIRDTNYRKEVMTESQGITIQTMCYQCQALTELCPDCQEHRDARDTFIAHQIVDESSDYYYRGYGKNKVAIANGGSVSEFRALSVVRDLPSGHDWTDREDEFLPPISLLTDRLYDLETSVTLTPAEVICQSCYLAHNRHSVCPNCN